MPEPLAAFRPAGDTAQAQLGAFRFRLAQRADIPHCVELLPSAFRLNPSIKRRLPALWEQLYSSEGRTFAVIEDLSKRFPGNIEAFGLSVFVRDQFADEFCASPRPYISALFYERMLADSSVLLSAEQVAAANAANGINVLVLHFGLRDHSLSNPRSAQAVATGSAAFFYNHGGYQIRTLLNEVYGVDAVRYMRAGGFRLIRDFQIASPDYFDAMAPDHRPCLFMLHRDWIEPGAVNPLSQLFFTPPPRILFSPAERRVLERALLNEPDGFIAAELGVSDAAIKKTWRNIFERVARKAPYLLPAGELVPGEVRGQEKRRHLLDYLRTHLEELRPFKPPIPR